MSSLEASEKATACGWPGFLLGCGSGALLVLALIGGALLSPTLRNSTLGIIASPGALGSAKKVHEVRPHIPASPHQRPSTSTQPMQAVAHGAAAPPQKPTSSTQSTQSTSPRPNNTMTLGGGATGVVWEDVPAVASYLWRGAAVCGDFAWRGSATGVSAAAWQNAIAIATPASRGVSNVMFWQVKFMTAWMLRRPVLLYSDGPVWNLLHSRHLPKIMQVSGLTMSDLRAKLGASARLPPQPSKFRDPDECNAHFQDLHSGEFFTVDMLKSPSSWKLSGNASLLLGIGSKNSRTLKHTVPLDCRNKMIKQLKTGQWGEAAQKRAMAITRDIKSFGKCSMRFAMGDPQPDLLQFIRPLLRELGSAKAFLVGIHFRMGDTLMSKELGRHSGADNDKRSQVSLQSYLSNVNKLLQALSEVLRPLDAKPLVFVASDNMAAVQATKKKLTCKVVTNPGLSVHTTDKKATSDQILKVYADWFLLALSGVLLSPSPGTNCNDGCGSGFSKTAGQLGLPWMSVLGRDITSKDIRNLKRLPVEALAKHGIYQKRGVPR